MSKQISWQKSRQKVIVVGGGIVGCLTALALRDRGCQVTMVERNVVAAQTSGESSWAGAGILFPLLPWMYKDAVNQLAMAGARLYPALCERLFTETGIDPEYTQSGMQILPPFDEATAINWCKSYQVPVEKKVNGLLLPTIAQVRPPHLLQALRQLLIQENVSLLENIQLIPLQLESIANGEKINSWKTSTGLVLEADAFVVTSGAWSFDLLKDTAVNLNIKPMRGQILLYENVPEKLENIQLIPLQLESLANGEKINGWKTTTGLVLEADAFVVTSGAWSFDLLKDTAVNLNIKPMRGQILLYENVPEKLENIIYSNGFYLVPRRDGLLLAGSTLEDVGFDKNTTEEVKQELQTKAESILPSLKHALIRKHWSGLRPGTPDNLPTIAAHHHIKNLYLNTGHFRYGLTMAPASAERVAVLIYV